MSKKLPKYPDGGQLARFNVFTDTPILRQTAKEQENKDFLTSMINSPLFGERYKTMSGNPNLTDNEIKSYQNQLLGNLNSAGMRWMGSQDPNSEGFTTEGYYQSKANPEILKNIEDIKSKYNITSDDPILTPLMDKLDKFHTVNIPFGKKYNPWVGLHEQSHSTTGGANELNIKPEGVALMPEWVTNLKYSDAPNYINYLQQPTEQKARVDVARKFMQDQGIYDPVNESFTKDHYNKMMEVIKTAPSNVDDQLREIFINYTPEDAIKLMNSFVQNDSKNNPITNQKVQYAAYGGNIPSPLDLARESTMGIKAYGGPIETDEPTTPPIIPLDNYLIGMRVKGNEEYKAQSKANIKELRQDKWRKLPQEEKDENIAHIIDHAYESPYDRNLYIRDWSKFNPEKEAKKTYKMSNKSGIDFWKNSMEARKKDLNNTIDYLKDEFDVSKKTILNSGQAINYYAYGGPVGDDKKKKKSKDVAENNMFSVEGMPINPYAGKSYHAYPTINYDKEVTGEPLEPIYQRTFGDKMYDIFHSTPRVRTTFADGGPIKPGYVPTYEDSLYLYNRSLEYLNAANKYHGVNHDGTPFDQVHKKTFEPRNLSYNQIKPIVSQKHVVDYDPMSDDYIRDDAAPVVFHYNPPVPPSEEKFFGPGTGQRTATNWDKPYLDVTKDSPIRPTSYMYFPTSIGSTSWDKNTSTGKVKNYSENEAPNKPTNHLIVPMYPKPKGAPTPKSKSPRLKDLMADAGDSDYSFAHRAEIAKSLGIDNYTGSTEQNKTLKDYYKGGGNKTTAKPKQTPVATPVTSTTTQQPVNTPTQSTPNQLNMQGDNTVRQDELVPRRVYTGRKDANGNPIYEEQYSRIRFAYGGMTTPQYEAEGGEVVDGGMPVAFNGGNITPNSTTAGKINGNTHEQGGVDMAGGKRVFSDRLYVDSNFLKDLDI